MVFGTYSCHFNFTNVTLWVTSKDYSFTHLYLPALCRRRLGRLGWYRRRLTYCQPAPLPSSIGGLSNQHASERLPVCDLRQPTSFLFRNLSTKHLHIIFSNQMLREYVQQTFVIYKTFTYNFYQSTYWRIYFNITFHDIQLTCIIFLENLPRISFSIIPTIILSRKLLAQLFTHKFTIQLPMKLF